MEFYDLDNQYHSIKKEFLRRLASIQEKSHYILGEEVRRFEEEFSRYCGTKYAVGVNSGTDALFLSLKALGIGKGDEVIVPAFTFIATSFAVSMTGAKPVFADIDSATYTIDVQRLEQLITKRTKAIIPVHLFGLCANMAEIAAIVRKRKLFIVEDAAQAHGAQIGDRKTGDFGACGCFSFYPTKNLSAFGDAGLITTNSKRIYESLLQLRDCGRSSKRYLHSVLGYNSRLDNVQAACLLLKLQKLDEWNKRRMGNARRYVEQLKNVRGVILPCVPEGYTHVFHVYSIRTQKRDALIKEFKAGNIPFGIFYPVPLHMQRANASLGYRRGDFPVSEQVAHEIISLPIHPKLSEKDIATITSAIKKVHSGPHCS